MLRRHDDESIDVEALRRAIESEIAITCDATRSAIALDVESVLHGRSLPERKAPKEPQAQEGAGTGAPPGGRSADGREPPPLTSPQTAKCATAVPRSESEAVPKDATTSDEDGDAFAAVIGTTPASEISQVHVLRARLWKQATLLAGRNYLEELVEHTPDQGCGYLLSDVPDPVLQDAVEEAVYEKVCALWWEFIAYSEMTVAPVACFVDGLPEESALRDALETQDIEKIIDVVATSDPGRKGEELIARLDDEEWGWYVDMVETYRRLQAVAAAQHTVLWELRE